MENDDKFVGSTSLQIVLWALDESFFSLQIEKSYECDVIWEKKGGGGELFLWDGNWKDWNLSVILLFRSSLCSIYTVLQVSTLQAMYLSPSLQILNLVIIAGIYHITKPSFLSAAVAQRWIPERILDKTFLDSLLHAGKDWTGWCVCELCLGWCILSISRKERWLNFTELVCWGSK